MELQHSIALALGVAWASGINLYVAVLTLGLLGATGSMQLPPNLEVVQHPLVISAAGVMFLVEFFADKIPGLDSTWDAIHTFIRIPAGAILAAKAIGPVDPAVAAAAGLIGGTLAATSHFTKAGTRVMVNTSPEPFSNWALSISEDIAVVAGIWAALHHPWIFIGVLLLFVVFAAWFLPVLLRGLKRIGGKLSGIFRQPPTPAEV